MHGRLDISKNLGGGEKEAGNEARGCWMESCSSSWNSQGGSSGKALWRKEAMWLPEEA